MKQNQFLTKYLHYLYSFCKKHIVCPILLKLRFAEICVASKIIQMYVKNLRMTSTIFEEFFYFMLSFLFLTNHLHQLYSFLQRTYSMSQSAKIQICGNITSKIIEIYRNTPIMAAAVLRIIFITWIYFLFLTLHVLYLNGLNNLLCITLF